MKIRIGRLFASVTACNFVFMPPFVRPIWRARVCLRLTAGCFKCSVVSTSSPRLLNRASSTGTYRENVSTTVRTRSFLLVASWSWRKSIAQTWFGPTASARSSAARVVQKLWSRNFFHKRAARGAPVLKPKAAPTVPPTSLISLRDRRIVLRGDRHEIGQDEILNRPVLDADMAHLGAGHEAVIVLHPRPQRCRGPDDARGFQGDGIVVILVCSRPASDDVLERRTV